MEQFTKGLRFETCRLFTESVIISFTVFFYPAFYCSMLYV